MINDKIDCTRSPSSHPSPAFTHTHSYAYITTTFTFSFETLTSVYSNVSHSHCAATLNIEYVNDCLLKFNTKMIHRARILHFRIFKSLHFLSIHLDNTSREAPTHTQIPITVCWVIRMIIAVQYFENGSNWKTIGMRILILTQRSDAGRCDYHSGFIQSMGFF